MAVETDADRLVYLDDFGVDVQIVGLGSPSVTFKAIYDGPYQEIDTFESSGLQSVRPEIEARTSDVASLTAGDSLLVGGVSWKFVRAEPDGTGMSVCILEKP